MGSKEFLEKCIEMVRQYAMEHLDKSDEVQEFEIYIVWYCKTLQNHKALLSTSLLDGMYYECTYNGDKKELYFDAYKKFENKCKYFLEVKKMDIDDEELKETKKRFNPIYKKYMETSLYEMEQKEKRLIRELKIILHDGECKPNWRETINDTIKLLEGE